MASLSRADDLLQILGQYHESQCYTYFLIEVLVIHALVLYDLGKVNAALATLGRAVQAAVPNGMIGPFIQQGKSMRRLLQQLGKDDQYHGLYYELVVPLLSAFPPEKVSYTPSHMMPDALTARELDVLYLMASGFSNKEIAQRLVLSANTVRNHSASLFDKLQVKNRLQAVDRSRTLGLLATAKNSSAQP